ncbi:uncharacterized protein ACA1_064260 [Acanthamoeba castellanii str. Neff]|uniref:Uncharacterized protein n=1 Tax=Acanthamoeba castellanii (strain ATCC 30010 / Neff) TaxID=1257118 RepID=L8GXI4_ACACF|nr:uncharacterized protein ACA1_064260 [Acanthamoeba castellanii str. Neff]ELR17642.1 hypothetical protein ACA1_064260 [Acanthamoeba castellanii str. Neff]
MVANRTVQLHEDMINKALGAWVSLWRMSDTAEMYFNRVIGLNNMAYNLSTSAAQTFDDFTSIPWVTRFRNELVCNLNFRQRDQDDSTTTDFAFAFPDYCVQSMASTSFTGDTLSELHQAMLGGNEELLLNNDYNQISLSCATPDSGVSSTYKWYCWMYFVQLSAVIDSDTCLCAADSCCPSSLGL